jgi:predicted glycosyltransferase involved in capsule biosynthesis
MKSISLITFSKNRIEQVKRFFQANLSLLDVNDEVVYVDYNDPQNSKDYVKSLNDPRIKIVYVDDVEFWQMNHARNLGGKHATKDILFFLDVDCIMEPELVYTVRDMVNDECIVRGAHLANISGGSCAITRSNFLKVNGYEEMFTGYGEDDSSFYSVLLRVGIKSHMYSGKQRLMECSGWREPACKDNLKFNQELSKLIRSMNIKRNNFQRTWGRGGKVL